jgi:excisionase family DNA binding protein
MTTNEAFFTVKEFADRIKVHPNTIKNLIKNGKLLAFRVGLGNRARYRIASTEIERMILMDMNEEAKKRLGIECKSETQL